MKRKMHYALAPLALFLAMSAPSPRVADYVGLDRDAEPFKSAFNRDTGKVRVVMLVAPT